jgi:hypothetical protein
MAKCRVCKTLPVAREGDLCGGCRGATERMFKANYYARRGNHRTMWCPGCGTVKINPKTEYCFKCKTAIAEKAVADALKPLPTPEQLAKDWDDIFG